MAAHEYDAGIDVLDAFAFQAEVNPRRAGSPHPEIAELWVRESPIQLNRLPRVVIVYTINDDSGFVDLWNFYRL